MLHNFIYAFHMPFFFFISGYLFRVKEDNLKDLLKRIWKSLILPYICLNLISDIFLAPTWYLSRTWPVKELFLFLTADGHGEPGPTWFLICLAWVWIAAWYLLRLPRKYQYTILIGCAIVAYYFPYQLYWRIDTAAMVLPFFMVGNYCKGKKIVQIRGGYFTSVGVLTTVSPHHWLRIYEWLYLLLPANLWQSPAALLPGSIHRNSHADCF